MKAKALTVLSLLAFGAIGAGPPREGAEVSLGGGVGEYQFRGGGCGGPVYRYDVKDMQVHATARVRKGDWAGALEVSQERGDIVSSRVEQSAQNLKPPLANGTLRRHTLAVLRGGYHWKYVGGEIGPGIYQNADRKMAFVPSAELWAGVPDVVYAYGVFFTGPWSSIAKIPIGLGLGYDHRSFNLKAGVLGQALTLDAQARVTDGLRLGADIRLGTTDDTPGWSAGLSATYTLGQK